MKKRLYGRSLSRDFGSRRALYRSQVRAMILSGAIKTTLAKAKAVQALAEKMVTVARKGFDGKRRVYAILGNDRKTTDVFFEKVVSALSSRKGGYTKLVKLRPRRGDRARMARLEWSEKIVESKNESKGKDKKSVVQGPQKGAQKVRK